MAVTMASSLAVSAVSAAASSSAGAASLLAAGSLEAAESVLSAGVLEEAALLQPASRVSASAEAHRTDKSFFMRNSPLVVLDRLGDTAGGVGSISGTPVRYTFPHKKGKEHACSIP